MSLNTRQKNILEIIDGQGSVQIKDLAVQLDVSEATIRRDLDVFAAEGLADRFHGGAQRKRGTTLESVHSEKMKVNIDEKKRIAKYAASLVSDGDSVFLDSGTTTRFIAQELVGLNDLTIITNNLDIAASICFHPSCTFIVTGGIRRDEYSVLYGVVAENLIKDIYVDIVFAGCDSIVPNDGIYNFNFMELGVKRSILRCGKQIILTADSSKFQQKAIARLCGTEAVDMIITDTGINEKTLDALKKSVQKVVCV